MPFMFEKLEVYQKAVDFAGQIAELTENFPRGYGFLVDQLNRAALSVAANIAEGVAYLLVESFRRRGAQP